MTSATVLEKLQKHEIELELLKKHENQEKNSKNISLKTKVENHDSNQEGETTNDEDDDLIKRFEKFFRKEREKINHS